uniref:Neprosin PEP catalytic domain-containing protein n=1 Tax=Brassica oleracea var. oleracea TaxID=109376 RepID=A0A0D3C497_BRAOL
MSMCLSAVTQGAEGSINDFDCVEIYKQPAFQHPLLKNHKIQETFSSYEDHEKSDNYEKKEHCPKGTVPILRQRNGSESFHLNTSDHLGQHFATMETSMLDGSIYRGAEAEISVHSLNLQDNQYSKGQIWLENGYLGQLNSIQAGWAVHARLYGDSVTRFTIYWTDISTGNWGLKLDNEVIGYWPKERFTELNKGASQVIYGGNTFMSTAEISPPMGNGYFPVADFLKTAHFKNVFIIDSNYKRAYIEEKKLRLYADYFECFRVTYLGYIGSNGMCFSYGGPGGRCSY